MSQQYTFISEGKHLNFASLQQRVTVTRCLKKDSYNFVTEMTRGVGDILNLTPCNLTNINSTNV